MVLHCLTNIHAYAHTHTLMCACLCVWQRERDQDRKRMCLVAQIGAKIGVYIWTIYHVLESQWLKINVKIVLSICFDVNFRYILYRELML